MGLGLLAFVAIGLIGGLMIARNVSRLRKTLDRSLALTLLVGMRPELRTASALRAALLVAVVCLMTMKPGRAGSLAALGIAVITGLIVGRTGRTGVVVATSVSP